MLIKKGVVSAVKGKKLEVWFPDMDSSVTVELPVLSHKIDTDAVLENVSISGTYTITVNSEPVVAGPGSIDGDIAITGKLKAEYTEVFMTKDVVIVIFWTNSLSDGIVLGRVDS